MLGAGLQFGRGCGDDRFYNPTKGRRANQGRQNDQLRRAQSDVSAGQSAAVRPAMVSSMIRETEDGDDCEGLPKSIAASAFEPVVSSLSNLERFLQSIAPSVPAQYLSKTTMKGWRTCDLDFQPYFVLGDLWESFKEWSAYGAGVPLVLNDSDSVVQYYVPYLSGIQIYGESLKSSAKLRQPGEDSDSDFRDSSSDGSGSSGTSDSEPERALKYMEKQLNHHHLSSELPCRMDRISLRDQLNGLQEDCSSDEAESFHVRGQLLFEHLEHDLPYSLEHLADTRGQLLFEHLEGDLPYCREPLADKISDLAFQFPELKTLRSCDLLPSSWFSVAWYPIYRIPTGPTLRDLEACFLTFHSLHTPMGGARGVQGPVLTYSSEIDGIPKMSLPVFGLASYKFRGSLWTPKGGYEWQLANSLLQSAENWLRLHQVNHPDFIFFSRR